MDGRIVPQRKREPFLAVKGGDEPGSTKATSAHYTDNVLIFIVYKPRKEVRKKWVEE